MFRGISATGALALLFAIGCTTTDQTGIESTQDGTAEMEDNATMETTATPGATGASLDSTPLVSHVSTVENTESDLYQVSGVYGKHILVRLRSSNEKVRFLVEGGGMDIPNMGKTEVVKGKEWEAYPQTNTITISVGIAQEPDQPQIPSADYTLEVVRLMDISVGDLSPIGPKWMLAGMPSLTGYADAPPAERPFLRLDTMSKAEGNGGCNAFNGAYFISPKEVNFKGLISTKKSCALDDLEAKLMNALTEAKSYRIQGRSLYLYDNTAMGGRELAVFTASE